MQLIDNLDSFSNEGLALTIGFFDGVHAGHQFLIGQVNDIAAREGLQSAILTFWPHPRLILDKEYKPRLLNSLEEKVGLLERLPLDYCIKLEFDRELAGYPAYVFMKEILRDRLNVKHLVIGYDHRFGRDRETGFEDYCRYGEELGMAVSQKQPFMEDGHTISSSFIRRLLNAGEVRLAARYLGYPFSLKGVVIEGFKVGRQIGFPTANLRLSCRYKCVPDVGAYAVWVDLEGKRYGGMLYIGNRPTVANGDDPSIEVNLFDFEGDLYGKVLVVTFVDKIRDQRKFKDMELLREQLVLDKEKARKVLLSRG